MSLTIEEAGVDTWSPAWYVEPYSHTARALRELAIVPTARGRLLADPIAGYRVGVTGGRDMPMMWAEGHPGGDRLALPDLLPVELDRLAVALDDFGLPAPRGASFDAWAEGPGADREGFAGIRRLDATVNIASSSTPEGLAVMAGVAAIAKEAPRTHAELRYGANGRLQTVYFRGAGGKTILGRWYDKGVESAAAPLGQLLRAEDQRRFVKSTRRGVDELTTGYVRSKFKQRFLPLWQASKGVTVAGPFKAADKLLVMVEAGELTAAQAERLAGHLFLGELSERTGRPMVSEATRRRRRRGLRQAGVVLADGVLDEVEVDLHDVLERALDDSVWETGGQG